MPYSVVDAQDLPYDPTGSSLTATDVRAALSELDADVTTVTSGLAAHEADTGNPHAVTAAQAGADPAGTAASAVAAHEADTAAHPAVNVTFDNATSGLTASDVQAALDEVAAVAQSAAAGTSGHFEVVVDGNPAAAVTTPDGTDWVYGWVD